MAEHLVKLWIRSDEDPSGIDWQAWLPKGITFEHAEVSSFPWAGVEHVITWWITRALSPEEWRDLVDAEGDVLARIVGESQFQGMAGRSRWSLRTTPARSLRWRVTRMRATRSHERKHAAEQVRGRFCR